MAWSNKAIRRKMVAEKSHSMGFMVRVEDKLHTNIIQPTDECYFTVRPVDWVVGQDDMDITNGTDTTPGDGISLEGTIEGTGEDRVFQFEVQASHLNLDPEEDWWYDITYVRDGYSIVAVAGEFEVAPNVTNRGAQTSYSNSSAHTVVIGVDNRNLLQVTASMPLPLKGEQGDPGPQGLNGTSIYRITAALPLQVNQTVDMNSSALNAPGDRVPQVGDILVGGNNTMGSVVSIVGPTTTVQTIMVL